MHSDRLSLARESESEAEAEASMYGSSTRCALCFVGVRAINDRYTRCSTHTTVTCTCTNMYVWAPHKQDTHNTAPPLHLARSTLRAHCSIGAALGRPLHGVAVGARAPQLRKEPRVLLELRTRHCAARGHLALNRAHRLQRPGRLPGETPGIVSTGRQDRHPCMLQ